MKPKIFLSAVLLTCVPALAQKPEVLHDDRAVLHDNWAVMKLQDADVGYVHTWVGKVEREGKPTTIETRLDLVMKMNRLGSTIEIAQKSTTVEDEKGKLIRIDSSQKMSNRETKFQVFFEDGKARLVTDLMGRKREQKIRCREGMVGPYRLMTLAVENGFKPGTEWDAETFIVDLQTPSEVYAKVLGPEEVVIDGKKMTLTKMESEMDKMPVTVTSWVDASGMPLRVKTPMAGVVMEMITSTKEKALAAVGRGELSPDIFEATMIVAREFLPFSRHATRAELDVLPGKAGTKVDLPATKRQSVGEPDANGIRRVTLERYVPVPGRTGTRPLKEVPSFLEASLASNTMIQSDEAEILEIAKQVVGDETDAWRASQKLEAWVNENLTDKGFGVGFASALEVCRDRSGDCSEHAVFLAALCRAAGIPSRVAMGLMYLGGIWGGHAWNEVYIDGEWFPLDATLGLGSVDALHLTMSSMTMKDGNAGAEFAKLIQNLGAVKIKVHSIEHDGKKIEIRPGAVSAKDGRYVNRLWGFSCAAPEGFELEPKKPRARIGFEVLEIEGKTSAGKRCDIGVKALSTQRDLNWKTIVEQVKKQGGEITETEIEIDGRPGRFMDVKKSGGRALVAVADAGKAFFIFEQSRVDGEADVEMFRRFLGGVDFDVSR